MILPIIVVSLLIFCAIGSFIIEKINWNNGVCKECGCKWIYYDSDHESAKIYRCSKCGSSIWISWPFIIKHK